MQFLEGSIDSTTRHDLAVGTIFRVAERSPYSDKLKVTLCLVDGRFHIPDVSVYDEDGSQPFETWYELSTLEVRPTYGGDGVVRRTLRSTDDFFTNIQHVEAEEALEEFQAQMGRAEMQLTEAIIAVQRAQDKAAAFHALAQRAGLA